ncbi:sialidase family protein [Streptomyces antnestii]|nr:sialidase family protein [Streptomyces sp. San01]
MPTETSVPFLEGHDGYASFRIPAVVATPSGVLLAFCEGRVGSREDSGNIDIVLKRSTDGGRSWGPLHVVAANRDDLAGNPAPVVLDTGRVLVVHVRNAAGATETAIRRGEIPPEEGRRVWVVHSDDDGLTWSPAREITEQVKRPDWRWYATGPGHAVQTTAGRLVIPANHSFPSSDGGHCLLSDDRGRSWRLGYVVDGRNVNETTVAELPDGGLYFNAREQSSAPGTRLDARSKDGGETLVTAFRPQAGLVGPVVQGSLLVAEGILLYAGPADPVRRARMAVRASCDDGVTWRVAYTVDGRPAAYSDLVRVDGGTVGLLYETGDFSAYESITFRRIPVVLLTAGTAE